MSYTPQRGKAVACDGPDCRICALLRRVRRPRWFGLTALSSGVVPS